MKLKHTKTPWTLDTDGFTRTEEQAQMVIDNMGTEREWESVGINDEDGFAEVVALAHPSNAEFIVKAVNNHDNLVDVIENLIHSVENEISPHGRIVGALARARKVLEETK